jgi:DMSO/TMAO reductase YedYZ molybdopterin-dependent catalytic subunit
MDDVGEARVEARSAVDRPVRRTPRGAWSLAGVLTGLAGLATSYVAAMALTVRESPVVAVAEGIIRITPGPVAEAAIDVLAYADKPVLLAGILLALGLLFAWAGRLARRSWWRPLLVWAGLAAVGSLAVVTGPSFVAVDLLPVGVGLVTWVVLLSPLTAPLRRLEAAGAGAGAGGEADRTTGAGAATRRTFLVRAGAVGAATVVVAVAGRLVGQGRRAVEQTRRLLRLPITRPDVPDGATVGLGGISPWRTPNEDFYLVHTAIVIPTIDPDDWELRIHGLVDRELRVSYADLVERQITESWVTLTCVSNPVGGNLVGNAWWSGVRVADLLAEAGLDPEADAVLQTSEDGWTCGTPLDALTDERDAMLAVGMNGRPLPIEHGFPVRMVVPGLYGYVSATKWVVDLEVTRFDRISAYWTERGWAERGPVKLSSRIDVPRSGAEVPAGGVPVGGVAWAQQTGVAAVEVAVDGGAWQPAEVAGLPTDDTWVQWAATVEVGPGEHVVRVRAVDKDGDVQTGVERDVLPDGATGWHEVDFVAV